MRWLRWLPWKFVVRRLARSQGFLDPEALLARLSRFGQPSEVAAPTELLRASALLHARGLINSQTIQYNLDWIWPYWIRRQFDPSDTSFIPRAFSLTHINLTHRNWTAVGLPDVPELPIVDPRGLVTPLYDQWSLDGWVLSEGKPPLLPSRRNVAAQELLLDRPPTLVTRTELEGQSLEVVARVVLVEGEPVCRISYSALADAPGWLVVALRPFNPEGISLIDEVALSGDSAWVVDGARRVLFDAKPDAWRFSHFRMGDVFRMLDRPDDSTGVKCPVGLATAAALFALLPGKARRIQVDVPLSKEPSTGAYPAGWFAGEAEAAGWRQALEERCSLQVPDPRWQFLFNAAMASLILHTPGDIYPGPYTYKRFWFRDAAFIIHALACAGLADRAEKAIDRFAARQTPTGYFLSQEGEWDSNGEALWAIARFCAIAGRRPKQEWKGMISRASGWICRKRLARLPDSPHAGLFPPGFSAEHLGPSDYYYWDDFWGVAGLRAAGELAAAEGEDAQAQELFREAAEFSDCIDRSLSAAEARLGNPAMPASPYRRLDPGSIGSIACGYPLKLWAPGDRRLKATVEFLIKDCFFEGGFFQDMSHSGINPYLTLHVAQVLLRAGDPRFETIARCTAELASPTGQWPEAIHPWTGGGCMGDGQHVWAAAEWLLIQRNAFVREEGAGLVLCSGLLKSWLAQEKPLVFGPAPTEFGVLTVRIEPNKGRPAVRWDAQWHGSPPPLEIRLPGFPPVVPAPGSTSHAF